MISNNQLRFIAGLERPDLSVCGNKFYNLARITRYLKVPKAYCLKSNAFKACLPERSLNVLKEKILLLRSNGGYQLNRIQKEIINELGSLNLNNEVKKELLLVQEDLSPLWDTPLIVRSSSPFEDSQNVSGAGIYESIGSIKSIEELYVSVKECLLSFFSLSALAHRLRIQEYDLDRLPALIIQQFMDCSLSGVTFSEDPISSTKGILVEYSIGSSSDSIESGRGSSKRFKVFKKGESIISSETDLSREIVEQIATASEKITADYGKPMEFEWLLKGNQIYVLQARPVTTTGLKKFKKMNFTPRLHIYNGYDDYDYLINTDLGDVSEVYSRSINKRKPVRDLAVKSGICVRYLCPWSNDFTGEFEGDR